MSLDYPMFWNEHGERVDVMISRSDASIDDIPRVMREHRDLRKALSIAVELLNLADQDLDLDGSNTYILRSLDYIKNVHQKTPM